MQSNDTLYFEARRLSAGSDPVQAEALVDGHVYFAVRYVDENMLIPIVETLVFIGRNLEPDDVGRLYFQDVRFYQAGREYQAGDRRGDLGIEVYFEGSTNALFEYGRALDELLRCSLRRRA